MKIPLKRAKDQFNLGLCWNKSQIALICPGSGWFTVSNHGTGLYLSISFMAHPCHFGMRCRAGCDHSASQGGLTIQDKFSPGHMRKAILKLFAYSFPFSVHFFFQIILCLSNRTDYYFSKCTHLITFQIKWQLRLLAGKTLSTSMLFLLCILVVMTISEDTGLESSSYVAENPHHLHIF